MKSVFQKMVPFPANVVRLAGRFVCALMIGLGGAIIPVNISVAADLYGLVIGIDDYVGDQNDLAGAVNDARDITDALKKTGAKEIVQFFNGEATKQNIQQAWFALVAKAKSGDTIILTFSGHGSQEPEPAGRNGETDGKNENFLLAGFEPSGEQTKERIVDDELFEWTKAADDKGIRVVLVADSCHSGTMHRSIGKQKVRYRKGRFRDITNDRLKLPSEAYAHITQHELKNVTFIGATSDDKLTPEVTIDGKWRGALSWSFARAIEGVADINGDGVVSQLELLGYIIPAVRAHVENQQSPQITPLRAASLPLISISTTTFQPASGSGKESGAPLEAIGVSSGGTIAVAVEGGNASLLQNIKGVEIVSDKSRADLVWDTTDRTVKHTVGGVVAENVNEQSVRAVITKWSALALLKSKMLNSPVKMELPNGDQRYRKSELVEIKVSGIRYPYITLFNLPPDGKVEFFLPNTNTPGDETKDWRNQDYVQRFRVSNPPYGAEHLVAIYSKQVLNGLHSALGSMRRPEDAEALRGVLEEALQNQKLQVGILSIYTGE